MADILHVDVCRLVVRVVSHIFHGNAQGRLHSSQEKPQMAAYRGLGMHFSLVGGVNVQLIRRSSGNAILQVYISCAFMGIRPNSTCF
jgi:hypothetical protein